MDFLRKQAKENFRRRLEAMHAKKKQARLLLGLTKPKEEPRVLAVVKVKAPRIKLWGKKKLHAPSTFPGRFSTPGEKWVSSTFASGFGFEKSLEKRGWKKLGAGAFSSVWARSETSTRVLKVTRRPDNWIDYIVWAAKNGYTGKFAPMVYSYKRVKGKKADFLLSVVERMDKTLSHVERKEDAKLTSSLFHTYAYSENLMAGVFLDEMEPGLADFTLKLHREFKQSLDLHEGNLMVRPNGSFVVTDPVAWGEPKAANRLKAKDFTFAGLTIYLNYNQIGAIKLDENCIRRRGERLN